MTNQDTLREIMKGYRLEKPNYPGKDANEDQLNGIYGVSKISSQNQQGIRGIKQFRFRICMKFYLYFQGNDKMLGRETGGSTCVFHTPTGFR